jgi:hypothetical protein
MNKVDLHSLVNGLIPRFYGFAWALIPDQEMALQMVLDAYSVCLVREKDFIKEYKFKGEKKEAIAFKKFLMAMMIQEIYQLALKRANIRHHLRNTIASEYQTFNSLSTSFKAVLFLKEKWHYSIESIQEVLKLERHQVLEALYNAASILTTAQADEGATHA